MSQAGQFHLLHHNIGSGMGEKLELSLRLGSGFLLNLPGRKTLLWDFWLRECKPRASYHHEYRGCPSGEVRQEEGGGQALHGSPGKVASFSEDPEDIGKDRSQSEDPGIQHPWSCSFSNIIPPAKSKLDGQRVRDLFVGRDLVKVFHYSHPITPQTQSLALTSSLKGAPSLGK